MSKNYSMIAIEWLMFVERAEGITIRHALSNDGEMVINDPDLLTEKTKKPKKYHVDGYCAENNTIYEFYGDVVHGNIYINQSDFFQKKYDKTKKREDRLRELGFGVVVMWKADWVMIRQLLGSG